MSLLLAITLVECRMVRETAIEASSAGDYLESQQRQRRRAWGDEKQGKRERQRGSERRTPCVCRRPDSKHLAYTQCNNAFNGALWPLDVQLIQETVFFLAQRTLTRDIGSTLLASMTSLLQGLTTFTSQEPTDVEYALATDHVHLCSRPQGCKASEEAF